MGRGNGHLRSTPGQVVRRARRGGRLSWQAGALVAFLTVALLSPQAATVGESAFGAAELDRLNGEMADAATAVGELEGRLGSLSQTVSGIEAAVSEAEPGTTGIDPNLRAADEALYRTERLFRRQARKLDQLTDGAGAETTLAEDASALEDPAAPLQVVSDAIRSGGQLSADILARRVQAEEQGTLLDQSIAEARSQLFEVARTERELRTSQAEILRLAQDLDARSRIASPVASVAARRAAEARELAAQTTLQLHELEQTELELRQISARLRAERARLAERDMILGKQLRASRRSVRSLDDTMAKVAVLIGASVTPYGIPALIGGEGPFRVCPVDEPHAYSDDFGAPRWGGGYHLHQGNDIFAPEGTPIRAPFRGVAERAANTQGGESVIVRGRLGYVYNAHLSAYGTLGRVSAGTIIGYVGNTGNASGTAPHDHFEWHPGGGSAVNPFPFLNAVC